MQHKLSTTTMHEVFAMFPATLLLAVQIQTTYKQMRSIMLSSLRTCRYSGEPNRYGIGRGGAAGGGAASAVAAAASASQYSG